VRRSLLLIAAIGVLLRLVAVIPVHANGPTSDEKDYLVLAHRLAAGQEFVDSDGEYSKRYPLFPAILAALLRVAGDQTWVLYLVNALFGGLTVLLSALLAGRLWGDPGVSRAVAWGVALYPGLVVYGAVLQTESLYIALFLCAFLCAYRVLERPAWWGMVALGLTAGLATLTRAVFLGFFPLLLLLLAVMQRKLSGNVAWKGFALAVLTFIAVLLPWTWRNYQVHGALIPVASLTGNLLVIGNNPFATGTWSTRPGFREWYREQVRATGSGDVDSLTEVERGNVAARIGWQYMVSHPLATARMALVKARIFWLYPITTSDSNRPVQAVAMVADVFLYLAALFGWVRMRKPSGGLLPVAGALAFFGLVPLILHAEARYRLPLVPLFCLFAAWTALPGVGRGEWKELIQRNRNRVRWAVAAILVLLAGYLLTAWMVLTGEIS
jgi:4-amino-4-deoxy-L-arabinose transferase-like glycosyltransferase